MNMEEMRARAKEAAARDERTLCCFCDTCDSSPRLCSMALELTELLRYERR